MFKIARTALCTNAQVIQTSRFNNEEEVGGSDIVDEAVEEAREEVLGDYGDPPKRSTFVLDSSQTDYEFRVDKQKTYSIEKVYILDDNNRREYTDGTASETNQEYTKDLDFNKITFHGDTVAAYSGNRIIIDYIPNYIHWLARLKAALYIIDSTNINNADENAPTPGLRIIQRIQRIEKAIAETIAIGSSNEKDYDPTYGEVIPQRRFWTYS